MVAAHRKLRRQRFDMIFGSFFLNWIIILGYAFLRYLFLLPPVSDGSSVNL